MLVRIVFFFSLYAKLQLEPHSKVTFIFWSNFKLVSRKIPNNSFNLIYYHFAKVKALETHMVLKSRGQKLFCRLDSLITQGRFTYTRCQAWLGLEHDMHCIISCSEHLLNNYIQRATINLCTLEIPSPNTWSIWSLSDTVTWASN